MPLKLVSNTPTRAIVSPNGFFMLQGPNGTNEHERDNRTRIQQPMRFCLWTSVCFSL